MSAPQSRSKRSLRAVDDEAVSAIGQRVWYIDQIEAVGIVKQAIEANGRILGFVIEDERSRDDAPLLHRVQSDRVRRYGERYFLVPSWYSKADQAASELERQLQRGLAPDHDRRFWNALAARSGVEILENVLRRTAPSTYAVVGQLASTADSLSHDLARAAVIFRRVQRAVVANQAVMAPDEYAEFIDQARKWGRTVRLILMALESFGRAVPRAQIDLRNPDAALPAQPIYIPLEALLDTHTPGGEGRARQRPLASEGEASSFSEVFGEHEDDWQPAPGFEPVEEQVVAGNLEEFHPVEPLHEYDEGEFEPIFEEVEEEAAVSWQDLDEEPATFEEVLEEVATPASGASSAPMAQAAQGPQPAPVPSPRTASASAPHAQALPEDDEGESGLPGAGAGKGYRPGSWLTPPPPPPPAPSTARQVERHERLRDKPDLESIIAASLGKTPKKSASKASQGEIATGQEPAPSRPTAEALSRELASLLEKSRKK
jgi:hypothetical protein